MTVAVALACEWEGDHAHYVGLVLATILGPGRDLAGVLSCGWA
jgi:hypothetical protein